MCFCHCSCLYKSLPILHGIIGFLECILGIIRLKFFFSSSSSSTNVSSSTNTGNINKKIYSKKYVVAFIIDWISSIVPTLIGLFTTLIILVILYKICAWLINSYNRQHGNNEDESNTDSILTRLLKNKALRRFLIVDCNCSCYKSRPKRRFQVRLALIILVFILRIVAIGLYASSSDDNYDGGILAAICAFSLIFLFTTFCLDLYRYCVWWHYTPYGDTRCHCRSKKHERYIPYHMIGDNRNPRLLGDRPCREQSCHKRKLDHIAVFHSTDYQPQDRWRDIPKSPPELHATTKRIFCLNYQNKDHQPHYIGFHTTTPEAAVSIAHSEFQPVLVDG
ncbi:unnamed protein product [Rotaria sp. Silwood2]|nr:unnamed protein product [Rotaria sp. Silwood2]